MNIPCFQKASVRFLEMSNGTNSWNVSFSRITFLEDALRTHANIASVGRERDILFTAGRIKQNDVIKILCCDEYALGMLHIRRGLQEFPGVDVFFAGGSWNGYTEVAKTFCIDAGLGLFNIRELSGALWKTDFWTYSQKDEKGNNVYYYKSA